MHGCAATCGHRAFVDGYRQERERQEIVAENASLGYGAEYKEWVADHPLPTLKEWMKHREKAPDMATDGWSDDSDRLANWDQKAEQQRARELQDLDRKAEAAAEKVEMQRYLAVDIEPPTLQEIRDYNETGLLGAAMVSDEALPALQTVRNEFTDVFHENVGKAILDQAADGAAHDAETVTAVLRERGQLVIEADTEFPLRRVEPSEYGLGAWVKGANPADANALAQAMRQDTRARYLEGVGERALTSAREALEAGEDPGLAFARTANDLVAMPAKLDLDLREVRNTATLEAVDTRKPRPVSLASEATTPNLGLPARPATMNLRAVASA
jgi:hypothetical protein